MLLNPGNDLGPVCIIEKNSFARKVAVCIEAGDFVVKTAENWDELSSIFKLRYDVFTQEYGILLGPNGTNCNDGANAGLDIDQFDEICDHLVVLHKKSGRAVGTYRLLSSEFTDTFYSQQEFVLQSLLDYPGGKLELGRACIDPAFRTGTVMRLLWAGLSQYVRVVDAALLFGCSSIKTTDPLAAAGAYKLLRDRGHVSNEFVASPAMKYKMGGFKEALNRLDAEETDYDAEAAKKMLPSLLESYLKAGGKICGEPVVDLDFNCVDFLTVLKTWELSQLFERRFKLC